MSYLREFPEFTGAEMPALPAGFLDQSWHNDVCPSFHHAGLRLTLWVEHPDPARREHEEGRRFSVYPTDTDGAQADCPPLLWTDSWARMLDFISNYKAPQC